MIEKVKKLIFQLRYILNRRQKIELLGVLVFIVFTTVVELLGVTIIFPFMEILMDYSAIQHNSFLAYLYNTIGFSNQGQFIVFLAIGFIIIYLLKNIFIIISYNFQYGFTFTNQKILASRMLKSYLYQDYLFHLDHSSAELIRGINTDIAMMFQAILAILGLIAETFVCMALGIYLLAQDPMMTAIIAVVMLLFVAAFLKKFKSYLNHIGEEDRRYSLGIVKWLQQSFNGLKETKIMHREGFFIKQFDDNYDNWSELEKIYRLLQMIPKPIMEFLSISAIMIAIIIKVLSGTNLTGFVSTMSVFAVAAFRLLPSFNRITGYISAISFYYPSFDAVYNELCQIDSNDNANNMITDNKAMAYSDRIDFDDVSFKYPSGDRNILDKVSFSIPKNSSVALIGPSGAGKTTLADVLLGVLKPTDGTVMVDGVNAYDDIGAWQKRVGYIPQTIYLMDDTIRNNILYGEEKEDNDDKIMKAVEEAQLTDFIKSLPDGLDTEIGEGGVRLSGGQRQRIGIARALYNNPDVLVLDEATSALDGDTEKAVMESIDALSGSKTLLIIAHRLTTIKKCDIKYEVNNSKVRIVDDKEFEELLLKQSQMQ